MMRFSPFLLFLLFSSSSAFSTTNLVQRRQQQRIATSLNAGAAIDWRNQKDESFLMQVARDCANSDSCSLEDAKICLDNVIRIQSACSSGSLFGSDVCEDVVGPAEIVAKLRATIDRESRKLSVLTAGSSVVNISLILCVLAYSMTGLIHSDPNVAPFTMQEWWWSVRDGYLPMMLKEYYQNGGLATANFQPEATPFSIQEFWWSVRDGYLPSMLKEYYVHGGLAGASTEAAAAVPFTPQEWTAAMKGGFLDKMIAQNFVDGGLTGVVSDIDATVPITPREWVWAVQGNYLDTMVKSYYEKGGM